MDATLRTGWAMLPLGAAAAWLSRREDAVVAGWWGLLVLLAYALAAAPVLRRLGLPSPGTLAVLATCASALLLQGWYAVLRIGEVANGPAAWVVAPLVLSAAGGGATARLLRDRRAPGRDLVLLAAGVTLAPPFVVWWAQPDEPPTPLELAARELESTGVPPYRVEVDDFTTTAVTRTRVAGNEAIEQVLQRTDGAELTVQVLEVRFPVCDGDTTCVELGDGDPEVVALLTAVEGAGLDWDDVLADVRRAEQVGYSRLARLDG